MRPRVIRNARQAGVLIRRADHQPLIGAGILLLEHLGHATRGFARTKHPNRTGWVQIQVWGQAMQGVRGVYRGPKKIE